MARIEARELKLSEVTFTLHCEPCEDSIEGNCSAIDDETDRETAQWIRDQLNAGNEWAWCDVRVTATWGAFEAGDWLGMCSYESEADFRAGGYYESMCEEALSALNAQISEQVSALAPLLRVKGR